MEAAIIGVVGRIAPLLFGFLQKKYKLLKELEDNIESIKKEFEMISATIEDAGDQHMRSCRKVHMKWIEIVRDLARDIEDCVDHFTHLVTRELIKERPLLKFADEINKLKHRSVGARQLLETYSTKKEDTGGGGGGGGGGSSTLEPREPEAYTAAPVGMDVARSELMELISERPQDQPKKLKVISIVGFGGIGKSQLADYAYNKIDESEYLEKAWVHAAGKDARDVLKEMHRQLRSTTEGDIYTLSKLRAGIKEYLHKKRFFIVIDGMEELCWDDLKDAFPVVSEVSSRVIVTTATRSVATKCSSANGHVYVMRTLDVEHSKKLLFLKASMEYPPAANETHLCSEAIKKCDGLPLALVTTARLLGGDPPTRNKWEDVGKNLGEYLEKEELKSMNRVLVRSYTSLGSQDLKNLLLYVGIFPNGPPIRRGRLIRKWLAEGLSEEDKKPLKVAVDNFDVLVDRSIIQPIDNSSSKCAVVKTCQTHGMMLEFILQKSMYQNFVTLLCDTDSISKNKVRWLSVQNNARLKIDQEDLRLVRSLTIFGKAHNSLLDFSKYKLMKVLDLEECGVKMEDSHLKDICSNLVLLRYLSLGAAVAVRALPKEIKRLMLLETLDVRRTKIEILPAQAMELPCLVHLFGKLKLQGNSIVDWAKGFLPGNSKPETDHGIGDRKLKELQAWLLKNSKLETLAGIVVDKSHEMPQLIEQMEHLTKVKIWCESTPNRDKIKHFRKAITGFIERGDKRNNALSLSLNFSTEWNDELQYLKQKRDKPYYLRSLKLQGKKVFSTPPSFLTMLGGLTKLCLSFPGHMLSSQFLAALIKKPGLGLEYLKLVATQVDNLVIREGALGNLRRLCVVVEVMTGLEVQEGALPRLDSLWLLCKDLNGFSGTTIQSLPLLKEVALHNGLSPQTKKDWKKEAKEHRRRPKVLFAETERITSEHAVKITFVAPATDTTTEVPDVTSEIASEPATATDHVSSINHCTIAQKENHGDGQHDHREKNCIDSSDDSKEFSTGNSSSTSTEISEGEMGGKDQRMEDDTQVPAREKKMTPGDVLLLIK